MSSVLLYAHSLPTLISLMFVAPGITLTLPLIHAWGLARKLGTSLSSWSWAYMTQQSCNCFRLLRHFVAPAFDFALLSAGNNMPAKIAMIAITTRSSMR